MNLAIIGAGLIGRKRAASLKASDRLKVVCDVNKFHADELAWEHSAISTDIVEDVINNDNIEAVIISVVNKYARKIVVNVLNSGKHVLCEKPLGQNVNDSKKILSAAENSGKIIKTGFNHRFHSAIIKAKELLDNNAIGKIINIRSRYGHGGRPGMEDEWRSSKKLCGGGELLDQGVHVIDLCRWFTSKEVTRVYGKTYTSFWNIGVEDNAFFNLEFNSDVIAQCHVSWTNWKNLFSFEIFGVDGYININGLGGSYGRETLELGYRRLEGGIPKIEIFQFENKDSSWSLEWMEFKQAIKEKREPNGSGRDGYAANKIVEAIYKASNINRTISII